MKIVLKGLNDDELKQVKNYKKIYGCDCSDHEDGCDHCPFHYLDCGNLEGLKIKVDKKKHKAVLIER